MIWCFVSRLNIFVCVDIIVNVEINHLSERWVLIAVILGAANWITADNYLTKQRVKTK